MNRSVSPLSPAHGVSRRQFLESGTAAAAALAGIAWVDAADVPPASPSAGSLPGFGLVTYQWAKDWDLDTLLKNCEAAGLLGVELRTTHAHGVEPTLDAGKRAEVKTRFADSPVTCLGPGSNERFDDPDPAVVARAIDATKAFVDLSRDIGASGVKVKPDRFHEDKGIEKQQTIEQIAKALHEVAAYAADLGQEIRLEVHGQLAPAHFIEQVIEASDHPNAKVCWNSNPLNAENDRLEANFQRLRPHFGQTCHIHDLGSDAYPYAELFRLLVESDYRGWLLLEEGKVPDDPAAALHQQKAHFDRLIQAHNDA